MTSRKKELLQKLNPNLLKMTPKLSGVSGTMIDLSSNENSLKEGAKKLMLRFLKNQDIGEKNRENQSEVAVSHARYNVNDEVQQLISEKFIYTHIKDDDDNLKSNKPGRKLQLLKIELQSKMSAKWEKEYKKRLSKNKNYVEYEKDKETDYEKISDLEKLDENSEVEEGCKKIENGNKSDTDKKSDIELSIDGNVDEENNNENDNYENLLEANENHSEIDKEINGSESYYEENFDSGYECSLVPAFQPGGGFLYGGSELTQSEEVLPDDLLLPSLQLTGTQSPDSKGPSSSHPGFRCKESEEEGDLSFEFRDKLFQNSQKANDSFDLNDAFAFCSGKFPESDGNLASQNNAYEQNSVCEKCFDNTKKLSDGEDEDSEIEENSGEETESESESDINECHLEPPKIRNNIKLLEDSEYEDNVEQEEEEDHILVGKIISDNEDEDNDKNENLKKKKRKILQFSDDEDASENCEDCDSSEEEEDSRKEDPDSKSINYDSEENEIINPREFFEKEAELSGSEWSGDEDEKGLDEFDREDGDNDVLDNDQVRSQLEKIHIRRVLDDDAREIRLIQELLFEDGDLHNDGKGRDRKFKWKNLGAFEDNENETENKHEQGNSSEDDCAEEEELRKTRYQKELFLMELKKNENLNSDDDIIENNFHILKVTAKDSLQLSVAKKKGTNFFGNAFNTNLAKPVNTRGSFLTRNKEFLSRLAKVSSAVSDNVLAPNHSKNYLFLSKSPKKEPEMFSACKRQVEETESGPEQKKKAKVLPKEINSGPSILDLLI